MPLVPNPQRLLPDETGEEALVEARRLGEDGIRTVVSLLGENVANHEEIEEVVEHYLGVLDKVGGETLDTHISVKLTHMGLDVGRDLARDNLERLVIAAAERSNVVWVDIEASPYVDATLEVFEAVRAGHENVALCLQAYLYRTSDDLDRLIATGARIRLVKGAYREPPDVAYPRKHDVDTNFFRLASRLIEHGDPSAPPGIATHDVALLSRLREEAERVGAPRGAYEVQMLYGIRRLDQLALAREGVPMRVLISYGPAWYPWYMRRLAERPANLGFVLRSMLAS